VNQAPSQSVIFVPGVGSNFELPGQNVQKPDSFAGIAGGIDFSWPLDGTYSMTFGGEFLGRRNFHEFDFDVGGYNLYLGLAGARGPHAGRIQGLLGRDYLGGSANRDLEGVTLSYVGNYDAATQILATAQAGRQRYVPEELKIFDADYAVLAAGAARKLDERSTVFAVLSTGRQNDVGGNPSGNKDLLGFQAGGEMLIGARIRATAAAVGERSRYDKFDTGFQTERRDLRRAFDLGAQYYFERNLSLRFNVSYAYTRSNIPIYEYTRAEFTLMLRRDFR
jgi:predicted porin